jgi:hypothetical protein
MALKIVIKIPVNFNLELNESELDAVRDYYGLPEVSGEGQSIKLPEQLADSIENELRQMIADIETDYLSMQ